MKKLISILMLLLLVMTSACAFAEGDAPEATTTPAVEATAAPEVTAEPLTAEEQIAQLNATVEELTARLDELTGESKEELATYGANYNPDSLITDGLLVTVIGLLGVFLVLILFFLTIKMMQKILK